MFSFSYTTEPSVHSNRDSTDRTFVNFSDVLKTRLTDSERYSALKSDWTPPVSFQFPATKSDKNRRFNVSWLSRFPGLVYDRQVNGAYCLQCSLFDTGNSRMLVREPFRNRRKGIEKFNEHFHNIKSTKSKTSTGHQLHIDNKLRAERFLSNFANGDSVILQLDKGLKARHDVNVKKIIFSSVSSVVLWPTRYCSS